MRAARPYEGRAVWPVLALATVVAAWVLTLTRVVVALRLGVKGC